MIDALKSEVRIDHYIGGGSTLLAVSVPTADTLLALLGKFLFAVGTAVVASWVSGKVRSWNERGKK